MEHTPFYTKEFSDIIGKFSKDELFPCISEINKLAIDVSKFRSSFWGDLSKNKILKLENRYKDISVKFINLYHKWNTPDILFKDLNQNPKDIEKDGKIIADYFSTNQAVMKHINESFRLLGYIDKILTGQDTAFYNRVSIALAIIAVTISIIVAILK
ncbi:MAG: hypothetical protein ABH956_00105 [Candidatus Nealsonbacteria bacterium]